MLPTKRSRRRPVATHRVLVVQFLFGATEQELRLQLPPGTSRSDGHGGERVGGYGLCLLDGLSDKVDFSETDPQGTTVRVGKKLNYDSKKDADQATERDQKSGAAVTASTK